YAHTREYLSVLIALLNTGEVDHKGTRFTVRARIASRDGLPVPVLLSGLGPKMLALAGTLAAGTITWMVGARTLREHIVPRIREAAAAAGRPAPRIVGERPLAPPRPRPRRRTSAPADRRHGRRARAGGPHVQDLRNAAGLSRDARPGGRR